MPLSKNDIKYIKSLRLKKFRQKYDNFVVEGDKIVRELLQQRPEWVESVYALDEWVPTLSPVQTKIETVPRAQLSQASLLKTPNQAIAIVRQQRADWKKWPLSEQLSIYLEDLQDPGNLGTILRIADWFGIPNVLCSPQSVDLYNPKVIQASMGAFLRVHYAEATLSEIQELHPGLPVFATVMEGENVFQAELPANGLLAIGNEGSGLSDDALQRADRKISVPPARGAGAESLNAAIATGIICAVLKNKAGGQLS